MKDREFAGQTVLITGGARGQGRSHALQLAALGADIAICDAPGQIATIPYPLSTVEDLHHTADDIRALGVRCEAEALDVRDLSALTAFAEKVHAGLGPVRHVVANAGVLGVPALRAATWEIDPQQWADVLDVNVTGVFNTCRAFIPHLLELDGNRCIVITSSTAGTRGMAKLGHYAASKHAVVGLMRTLALELGELGVRVNTVHPTGVESAMIINEAVEAWLASHTDVSRSPVNVMPVERIEPEDVSNAVTWLLSDQARYVTGTTLPVDAGFQL